MIVSLPCPELTDASRVSDEWSTLETRYSDQLLQKKLRVNFVISDEEENETHANETSFANATSSGGYGSGAAAAGAGIAGGAAAGGAGDVSRSADDTINNTVNGSNRDTTLDPSTGAGVGGAASGPAGVSGGAGVAGVAGGDDAQRRELEASNAKINTMSEKLDSNEKAPVGSSNKTATEEPVSGISVPFAVVLVIIALLLGWYIF